MLGAFGLYFLRVYSFIFTDSFDVGIVVTASNQKLLCVMPAAPDAEGAMYRGANLNPYWIGFHVTF